MDPRSLPPGMRSTEEVLAAFSIALAMFEAEPHTSTAHPWLYGMVAAGQWLLGADDRAPISGAALPITFANAGHELLDAGAIDIPGVRAGSKEMYARGAYRMLAYALALRDELPVKLSRDVAQRLARDGARAA